MMTICENSATPLCGEPYPNTASPVARWTRALPRWVIYTRVSLKLLRRLSAVAFDYVFVFRLFPLGIKNTSSWIQPKLFQYWVEESGFHILRHAWPPIWDCAEKGDFNQAGCLNCFYFHRLYLIVALNFLREVLVEFWRLFKPLFLRNCCLKALRAVPRACSKSPFSSWHEPASTLFQSLSKAVTSHGGMMFSKWLLYFSFNRTITRELLAQMRFFSPFRRLRPSNSIRRKCLVLALAEILWRAGEEKQATVAMWDLQFYWSTQPFYWCCIFRYCADVRNCVGVSLLSRRYVYEGVAVVLLFGNRNSGRNQFTPARPYRSEGVLEKVHIFIFALKLIRMNVR